MVRSHRNNATMGLESLGIRQAAQLIASGNITSKELVDHLLQRIDEFEATIHAWAWLDRDYVLRQAESPRRYKT